MDDKPFAFFGHSLGALLGFEMARLLRRKGGPRPLCLLVSGCRAPHVPDTRAPIHELPEPEFLEELRHLNGSPPEALEHAELMQMLLPCLRADFETYATYVYEHEPPLDCPIHAFGGQNDVEVPPEALAAWGEQTGAAFSLRLLPGDHFFVNTARSLLLELLSRELRQIVVGTPVREAK
jgi:medium-chain acyl-[acyl-carrier-protein] hydrolase